MLSNDPVVMGVITLVLLIAGVSIMVKSWPFKDTPPRRPLDQIFKQIAQVIRNQGDAEGLKSEFIREWERIRFPNLIVHLPSDYPREGRGQIDKFLAALLVECKEAEIKVEVVDHYDYSVRLYWQYRC